MKKIYDIDNLFGNARKAPIPVSIEQATQWVSGAAAGAGVTSGLAAKWWSLNTLLAVISIGGVLAGVYGFWGKTQTEAIARLNSILPPAMQVQSPSEVPTWDGELLTFATILERPARVRKEEKANKTGVSDSFEKLSVEDDLTMLSHSNASETKTPVHSISERHDDFGAGFNTSGITQDLKSGNRTEKDYLASAAAIDGILTNGYGRNSREHFISGENGKIDLNWECLYVIDDMKQKRQVRMLERYLKRQDLYLETKGTKWDKNAHISLLEVEYGRKHASKKRLRLGKDFENLVIATYIVAPNPPFDRGYKRMQVFQLTDAELEKLNATRPDKKSRISISGEMRKNRVECPTLTFTEKKEDKFELEASFSPAELALLRSDCLEKNIDFEIEWVLRNDDGEINKIKLSFFAKGKPLCQRIVRNFETFTFGWEENPGYDLPWFFTQKENQGKKYTYMNQSKTFWSDTVASD